MRGWLKTSREAKSMTQKSLAEKLGVSESYYCAIENGQRQKNMDLMLAAGISAALGIPVAEIMAEEKKLIEERGIFHAED